MTIIKPNTLQELVRMRGKIKDLQAIISKQGYYDIIGGKHTPKEKTVQKFCEFLGVDEKTFHRLLKNSLK